MRSWRPAFGILANTRPCIQQCGLLIEPWDVHGFNIFQLDGYQKLYDIGYVAMTVKMGGIAGIGGGLKPGGRSRQKDYSKFFCFAPVFLRCKVYPTLRAGYYRLKTPEASTVAGLRLCRPAIGFEHNLTAGALNTSPRHKDLAQRSLILGPAPIIQL